VISDSGPSQTISPASGTQSRQCLSIIFGLIIVGGAHAGDLMYGSTPHASESRSGRACVPLVIAAVAILVASRSSAADTYIRTGDVIATECTNWLLIQSCKGRKVDRVSRDGKFFEIALSFEGISEFNGMVCHIFLKKDGLGFDRCGIKSAAWQFHVLQRP
jgi:hypothetical protein